MSHFPILFIVHTNLENCQWIPMLLSLILESNLIVDHETKSCMLRESPFKCFECLYFLKIWWAKKTAALKICDSGVYIFIFVDFIQNHLCPGSPKIWKSFLNSWHCSTENSYTEPKTSFPKKLVCVLPSRAAQQGPCFVFSEYYFVLCTPWHPV